MHRFPTRAALALAALLSVAGPLHAQTAAPPQPAAAMPVPAGAAPDMPAVPPVQAVSLPSPDLSLAAMINHADRIVQIVMAGLAAASVLSWTILLAKSIELLLAGRAVRRALDLAEEDAPDATPHAPRPLLLMRHAVRSEIAACPGAPADGTKDRLASRLLRIEHRLVRQIQRGTGFLATIGATAPFVGLFGTVWGIMNSFIGIARLHTTNLAVVAPGITEALLATATGLVAAIPAVVIYNVFARWIGAYKHSLADLGEIVLRHAARGLDMPAGPRLVSRGLAAE